jgi:hypothetical protein
MTSRKPGGHAEARRTRRRRGGHAVAAATLAAPASPATPAIPTISAAQAAAKPPLPHAVLDGNGRWLCVDRCEDGSYTSGWHILTKEGALDLVLGKSVTKEGAVRYLHRFSGCGVVGWNHLFEGETKKAAKLKAKAFALAVRAEELWYDNPKVELLHNSPARPGPGVPFLGYSQSENGRLEGWLRWSSDESATVPFLHRGKRYDFSDDGELKRVECIYTDDKTNWALSKAGNSLHGWSKKHPCCVAAALAATQAVAHLYRKKTSGSKRKRKQISKPSSSSDGRQLELLPDERNAALRRACAMLWVNEPVIVQVEYPSHGPLPPRGSVVYTRGLHTSLGVLVSGEAIVCTTSNYARSNGGKETWEARLVAMAGYGGEELAQARAHDAELKYALEHYPDNGFLGDLANVRPLQPLDWHFARDAKVYRGRVEQKTLPPNRPNWILHFRSEGLNGKFKLDRVENNCELFGINYKPAVINIQHWINTQEQLLPSTKNYDGNPRDLFDQWNRNNYNHDNFMEMNVNSVTVSVARTRVRERASCEVNQQQYTAAARAFCQKEFEEALALRRINVKRPLFRPKLEDIKSLNPKINVLSLFCGIGPEIRALLDLGIEIGTVIVMDIDPDALGVLVVEHPDITFLTLKFPPDAAQDFAGEFGDVKGIKIFANQCIPQLQERVGGIHLVIATPPCQDFSLAGSQKGARSEKGSLFQICFDIFEKVNTTGGHTFYVVENTNTSKKSKREMQSSSTAISNPIDTQGYHHGFVTRMRRVWVNFPPALEVDLRGALPERLACNFEHEFPNRVVNRHRMKFNTVLHSKATCVDWDIYDVDPDSPSEAPKRRGPTADEVTFGFGHVRGYGCETCGPALMHRWEEHDGSFPVVEDASERWWKTDSGLGWNFIVDLTGAADDAGRRKPLSDAERIALLGNSVIVGTFREVLRKFTELYPVPIDAVAVDEDDEGEEGDKDEEMEDAYEDESETEAEAAHE